MPLTKTEQESFKALIDSTKGLSSSGNRARVTLTLEYTEVQSLITYANFVGLDITSAVKRLFQDSLQNNLQKKLHKK
jgi:hypothetical protein